MKTTSRKPERQKTMTTTTYKIGDQVRFNSQARPKYLHGETATVVKVNAKSVRVDVDKEQGRFMGRRSKNIGCPLGIIQPADAPQTTEPEAEAPALAFRNTPDQQRFIDKSNIVGQKIIGVHYTTDKEAESLGWYSNGAVLVLDNGLQVFIQADDEGNGPGAAVIVDKRGNETHLPVF